MIVNLKKTNENAVLPKQAKNGDFCYDVWAVDEEEISQNVWRYRLGFKYEIDRNSFSAKFSGCNSGGPIISSDLLDNFSLSIDLRPRSGIYKTGMVLANSEGTFN